MRRDSIIVCLALVLVIGAGLLLWSDVLSRRRERRLQEQAQQYFENEKRRSRPQARKVEQTQEDREAGAGDWSKFRLRGVTLRRPGNAFQKADFTAAVLDDATLEAGTASFQLANFDKASLRNAKLVGGPSSFQEATFVGADLTAARLAGNFQLASFEEAVLVRAKWSGSFQLCNISGAHFAGADLSEIEKSALESCYFKESPTYRSDTTFPADFDPSSQGWRFIQE